MLILEHDKAKVSLESERADDMVGLIDSSNLLEEIVDAYVMCLGQGE